MEDNDIGVSYVARHAVRFEGLLMWEEVEEVGRFRKKKKEKVKWRVHDMAMKSLLHQLQQLKINVQVITYLGDDYEDEIETWLARKGAHVEVVSYDDPYEWAEDLRKDREIQRYYTADAAERDIIGWQHVTVVRPSQAWG